MSQHTSITDAERMKVFKLMLDGINEFFTADNGEVMVNTKWLFVHGDVWMKRDLIPRIFLCMHDMFGDLKSTWTRVFDIIYHGKKHRFVLWQRGEVKIPEVLPASYFDFGTSAYDESKDTALEKVVIDNYYSQLKRISYLKIL